jgi:hypothetical protein
MEVRIRVERAKNDASELSLELEGSIKLESLLCIIQDQAGITPSEFDVLHNNRTLINLQQTLDFYQISSGSRITIRKKTPLPTHDYFLEGQKRIEQAIRQKQIDESYQKAMEWNPESFVPVEMLFIQCELNKHPIRAFVDTGAQKSIIGPKVAERCGITNLIDSRFQGMAVGVGQSKIVGSLHYIPVKIGMHFLPCSLYVVEGQEDLFILGLDMLKKHQVCVDLKKNVLLIQEEQIPFVSGAMPGGNKEEVPKASTKKSPLETLMEMGVEKETAISALEAAQGDLSLAISFCF